jgi:hypothetical protein
MNRLISSKLGKVELRVLFVGFISFLGVLLALSLSDTNFLKQTAQAQTATVETDQANYSAGDMAEIFGSGWQPGESVMLEIVGDPAIDPEAPPDTLNVVADSEGNISNEYIIPGHGFDQTFTLTATGMDSGLSVQNTFTNNLNSASPPAPEIEDSALATVMTDKGDYIPGEVVQITGSGWEPGETVELYLVGEPPTHDPETIYAVTDESGKMFAQYVVQEYDLGRSFTLTATGMTSGLSAQTTFTDSQPTGFALSAPTSVTVLQGNSAGYTANVTMGGNSGLCTVTLSVTTALPTGAVATFAAPNPTTTNANFSRALTISTTGATPAGTYPFTVQAARGADCQGNGNETTGGTLVVCGGCLISGTCYADQADNPANSCQKCDVATTKTAFTNKSNGTSCSDGNACTQTDSCNAGSCTGSNPVVCTALDQCHVVGTCNPSTGVCSNPNADNQTPCDDEDQCTQVDKCNGSGKCVGSNNVQCTALDECHVVGTCDSADGVCSNPIAPDGTACTNGTCQSGICETSICGDSVVGGTEACDEGAANGTAGSCCSATCQFKTGGTECRASAGQCDVAETCTGSSGACPVNGFAPDTMTCVGTSNGGVCDDVDKCSGTANTCVDKYKPSSVVCRPEDGQCDVEETCTGSSGACPADVFAPATTLCMGVSQGDLCDDDANDHCFGPTENTCVDAFQLATYVCRDAASAECDIEEKCTGSSGACPEDVVKDYYSDGFDQPVDNPMTYNKGTAGKTYPMKLKLHACVDGEPDLGVLYDCDTSTVLNNPPKYTQIACPSNGAVVDLLEMSTPSGETVLRCADSKLIFNWQTQKSFAGKCYKWMFDLSNGDHPYALFNFVK